MLNSSLFLPIVGFVKGIEGAKNYPMTSNQTAYLFDQERDSFYVKVTDIRGVVTCFKEYGYEEIVREDPVEESKYVTKAELEELFSKYLGKERDNGKHPIQSNGEQRSSKPTKPIQS